MQLWPSQAFRPDGAAGETRAIAGVLLVAFNLRGAVVAVAPLLTSIRHATGMSGAAAGLLTAVPVFCFGACATLGPRLARRIGIETTLVAAMSILAAGVLLRLTPAVAGLFAGTVLVGAAIAWGNVLLPAFIKRDFSGRVGPTTAMYVTSLSVGATLAAGATVPLRHALGVGWRPALGVWVVPAMAAALWMRRLVRRDAHAGVTVPPPLRAVRGLHRDRLAWQVTGYMGLQSFSFYATTSWLPSLFTDHGVSDSRSGLLLAVSSLAGIPPAIGIPVLAARARRQQHLMAATMTLWLAGLIGLLIAPTGAAPVWMVLLGLAQGSSLGLALTLIVLRSPDSEHAAQLSSMAQGIGYTVAALGPLALGALHDVTDGWTVPLLMLIAIVVPQLALGLGASRDLRVGGLKPLTRR